MFHEEVILPFVLYFDNCWNSWYHIHISLCAYIGPWWLFVLGLLLSDDRIFVELSWIDM